MKCKSTSQQITTVGITEDKITGRGSLLFILRYLEKSKIFNLIETALGNINGNKKAKSSEFMLRQVTSYPRTFSRKLIPFAAKIIGTGNRIILQVSKAIWEGNRIWQIWQRCNNPVPLQI